MFRRILEERFKLYLQFLNTNEGLPPEHMGASGNILIFLEPALKLFRPSRETVMKHRLPQKLGGLSKNKQNRNNRKNVIEKFLNKFNVPRGA